MITEDLEEEHARYVFPDEAAHQLVIAVVLRGVLDYRNELYSNIYLAQGGYEIKRTKTIESFERFFQEIGFDNYKSIADKVIDFRREVDKIPFSVLDTKERYFKCPLCGGIVTVKRGKSKKFAKNLRDRAKRASCDTCQFRIFA